MNADPGYEWEETPRSERLLAALAGHTLGMAPVNATRTSLRAPLLRLPADQSRSAKLGDGKRAAHRSPVRSLSPHNRRPAERSPDSGVDMATQISAIRRFGSGTWAKLAFAANSVAERSSRQRRRAVLTEQHRLHFDLLCKAMDDPALASVLNTYETEITHEEQRQYLFANALYINALYFYRIGALSRAELHGHFRVMCQNMIFRKYWAATEHHRKSLPDSSEEAKLGRMMDGLIQDQADSDTEEWWVVGEPDDESQ